MAGSGWSDGFGAWQRLRRWHDRAGESSTDGGAALDALADIGAVRRLLDQTELTAVRAARRQGKAWAEIAVRLGVTRQSAWERWRDVDDERSRTTTGKDAAKDVAEPAHDVLGSLAEAVTDELVGMRGSLAAVPDVVGLGWETARRVLASAQLVAVSADPDGPTLSGAVVLDQKPAAGERRSPGGSVTLWLSRGPGSAGVREPLHPRPTPRSTGGAIDEQTGEPVP